MTGAPVGPARSALRIGPRMLLLVGIGVLGPLSLLGWAAVVGLNGLADQVIAERQAVARTIGLEAEHAVREVIETLSAAPASPGFDIEDADSAPEREALRTAHLRARPLDAVLLARLDGPVVLHEPDSYPAATVDVTTLPAASTVVETGRPMVTSIVGAGNRPAHVFLVPVRDRAASRP
jgi:hypothetical protein